MCFLKFTKSFINVNDSWTSNKYEKGPHPPHHHFLYPIVLEANYFVASGELESRRSDWRDAHSLWCRNCICIQEGLKLVAKIICIEQGSLLSACVVRQWSTWNAVYMVDQNTRAVFFLPHNLCPKNFQLRVDIFLGLCLQPKFYLSVNGDQVVTRTNAPSEMWSH